jgi:sugar/nucleoside kinase (ribokinase family)
MSGRARIACVGDLLVELVCTSKNGHHRQVGTYTGPYPSGAAGIFIDQAARTGGDCIFVGAVGDDAFGEVVLDRLRADGVRTQLIQVLAGVPTGTAFVSYNDDGSRDFVYNIALSAAAGFDVGEATIAGLIGFRPDLLHVSGSALGDPTMGAKVVRLCKALHAAGTKISFDPNVRKELLGNAAYFELVRDVLAISSIFLPSEDDAATLFAGQGLDDYAATLFRQGMTHVVLKKGESGCEGLRHDGQRVSLAAHRVEVLDPTGAGDCFCATFVTLTAAGNHDFRQVMERANAAGALAVTKVGPMEGASTLATVEAFLKERA